MSNKAPCPHPSQQVTLCRRRQPPRTAAARAWWWISVTLAIVLPLALSDYIGYKETWEAFNRYQKRQGGMARRAGGAQREARGGGGQGTAPHCPSTLNCHVLLQTRSRGDCCGPLTCLVLTCLLDG